MSYFQELRQTTRALAKNPGFTAVAIATLGLGIGGTTAVFAVIDSVLLRPLSFAEPDQLALIVARPATRPGVRARVSSEYLHTWRLESEAFQDMAGWYDRPVKLAGRKTPLAVAADHVTPNFFDVLAEAAHLGRTFSVGSDLSDVKAEAVLSHGLWQRRYGGDPDVIGRAMTLDGKPFTIIGVMPRGFTVPTVELAESRAELWLPFALTPEKRNGMMGGSLSVVARLSPDASLEQARSELLLISQQLAEEYSTASRSGVWVPSVTSLHQAMVRDVRLALTVLFGAVGILLLIACVNIANLVLSRATTRRTELSIRRALGATLGRLVRHILSEALVIAAFGGALGVVLALWTTEYLVSTLPAAFGLPRLQEIVVDLRVLTFTVLATACTAILVGLIPALSTVRGLPHTTLRQAAGPGRNRNRLQSALMVSEVAFALILLSGAALLGHSLWNLSRVNPGFVTDSVVTLRTTLAAIEYSSEDRIRAFGSRLLERLSALPEVRTVGSANYLPMTDSGIGTSFEIEGRRPTNPEERPGTWKAVVGGRYFEAMGIPLLRGRVFSSVDTENSPPVFVIDEALARRHWPDEDPIGAQIALGRDESAVREGEIIGVVGSVRYEGLARDPNAIIYSWFPQDPSPEISLVARTAGDPLALTDRFAAEVAEIDPDQPLAEFRLMKDRVSGDVSRPRVTVMLLGGFAAAALLLASIGLYGVLAFGVTHRTKEIGIRVAVGADPGDVVRLIMGCGLRLTGAGLAMGIAASLALGPAMAGLLYGVTPTDMPTLLATVLFVFAIAVIAIYLPARHASRLDATEALRHE